MGQIQRGEFCHMRWLFVDIQCSQDGPAVDIKDLQRIGVSFSSCGADYLITWTSPESSPATTSLPSERIFALLAVSLNLAMFLTTFCVFGANIWILVPEVTAYCCGRDGEKWIEVTGVVSLMKTGFLKRLQYFDSGERLCVVRGCCFTTTG